MLARASLQVKVLAVRFDGNVTHVSMVNDEVYYRVQELDLQLNQGTSTINSTYRSFIYRNLYTVIRLLSYLSRELINQLIMNLLFH